MLKGEPTDFSRANYRNWVLFCSSNPWTRRFIPNFHSDGTARGHAFKSGRNCIHPFCYSRTYGFMSNSV